MEGARRMEVEDIRCGEVLSLRVHCLQALTSAYNTTLRELVEGELPERGTQRNAAPSATPSRSLRTKLRTTSNPPPSS